MPSRPTRRSAEDLATVTLESRAPSWRGEGVSALEAIAWLGGERPSQAPRCASPVLAAFVASCNDRWPDAERQLLKPYLPRIAGSGSGAAAESWRAHLLGDRALRVWALASARDAGRLAGTWGAAIRAQARRLEDVEPLSGPHSALDAAAVAAATAREIERIGALVEACADGGERVCAGAHVGAHALAVEALTSAAHAARALAAGATETATGERKGKRRGLVASRSRRRRLARPSHPRVQPIRADRCYLLAEARFVGSLVSSPLVWLCPEETDSRPDG